MSMDFSDQIIPEKCALAFHGIKKWFYGYFNQ